MWGVLAYTTLILLFLSVARITNADDTKKEIYNKIRVSSIIILTAFITVFEYLTFTNSFVYQAIFENSSKALPAIYKLTVLLASRGGSILFWLWVLDIFIYISKPKTKQSRILAELLEFPLIIVLIFIENPFAKLKFNPNFGAGMNILLQTPEMVIHPPLLFAGYAAVIMPLICAIDHKLKRDKESEKSEFVYSRLAWILLTLGIAWGALWSYKVLGWGGFWGWDPVENSSLVPWLFLSAGMHLPRRYTKMKIISYHLSIISSYLGTMVTRSGLLSQISNHAWWSNLSIPLILSIVITSAVATIYAVKILTKDIKESEPKPEKWSTRSALMYITFVSFIFSSVVILIGIYTPIISKYIFGNPIDLSKNYYTTALKPVGIILFGIIPACITAKSEYRKILTTYVFLALVSFIGVYTLTRNLDCSFAGAIAIPTIVLLIPKIPKMPARSLMHIGVTMIFISAIFAWSLQVSQPIMLVKKQPVKVGDNFLEYIGNKCELDKGQGIITCKFDVLYVHGNTKAHLYPTIKLKLGLESGVMIVQAFAATPAIYSQIYKDIWVVPDVSVYSSIYYKYGVRALFDYISNGKYLWLRYCEFPLIPELWAGCWIAVIGAALDIAIYLRKKEKYYARGEG